MKFVVIVLLAIFLAVPVAAQDLVIDTGDIHIRVYSGEVIFKAPAGVVVVETLLNGERFSGADTELNSGTSVKYQSGEKFLGVFADPGVQQQYDVDTAKGRVEDTVYLKSSKYNLGYHVELTKGSYLEHQPDGSVCVVNPEVNAIDVGQICISRPVATDAKGQTITKIDYVIGKDGLLEVKLPEVGDLGNSIAYPIAIDPVIEARYYLKALIHGNIEAADAFSTSVIRDSSTAAHMPVLDVASTGSGLNTTNVKFGNASIFLKNGGAGNPISVNMTDSSDWTLSNNDFTICTWIWQKNFTSQTLYTQQQGTYFDKFNLSCPGYVSGTMYWQAYRGGSTESVSGALSASAIAAAEAGWNRYCAIKNGSTISIYMNSTLLGSGTATVTKTDLSGPASFGKDDPKYFDLSGKHYDEIIFLNGVGLPIDSPLLTSEWPLYSNASPQGGYGDDNSTVALLHMDGSDGGGFFKDEIANRTWTVAGGAVTATNASKFGPTGGFFTSSTITDSTTADFDMGTGDWTVDFWVKPTQDVTLMYMPYQSIGSTGWGVVCSQSACSIRRNNSIDMSSSGLTLSNGVYSHIEASRNGTTLRIFKDGNLYGSGTISAGNLYNMWGTAPWLRGINATFDEVRVTKRLARHTANFTPPSTPYGITSPSFVMSPTKASTVPATIIFNSTTPDDVWTQNGWYWDFGDGSTATTRNASHTYSTAGTYTPILQTFNNNMTAYTVGSSISPGAPVVDFVCTPLAGTAALLVECEDLTTNMSTHPVTAWNMSWGDGYYTTTAPVAGKWLHVYATFGSYGVNLTETNDIGTDYEYKPDYIITSTSQNTLVYTPPTSVTFHVQTLWGAPIAGATVNASPYWTTLGSYAYVADLFGYNYEKVPLNTLEVNGTTDTYGDISLVMMPSVQYNVTVAKSGYTFQSINIFPDRDNYIIVADFGGSAFVTNGTAPEADVMYNVTYTRVDQYNGTVNVTFDDLSGTTTGGTLRFYNSTATTKFNKTFTGNKTTMTIYVADGPGTADAGLCTSPNNHVIRLSDNTSYMCYNSTVVDDKSYAVESSFSNPGGDGTKTATVTFTKYASAFTGIPMELVLMGSMGIILVVGMGGSEAGRASPAVMFGGVCFLGWIFYVLGVFSTIDAPLVAGLTRMAGLLTFATFLSILAAFVEYRRSGK